MDLNTEKSDSPAYVLVHPHFSPETLEDLSRIPATLSDATFAFNENLVSAAHESTNALSIVERNEALHRFYRQEIDEIARDPNGKLLILQMTYEWEMDQFNEAEWRYKEEITGLTGEELKDFCKQLYSLQEYLITYANEKLGSRLSIITTDPDDIEPEAKVLLSGHMKIYIFGETRDSCVQDASLALSKTFDVTIEESKCPT